MHMLHINATIGEKFLQDPFMFMMRLPLRQHDGAKTTFYIRETAENATPWKRSHEAYDKADIFKSNFVT